MLYGDYLTGMGMAAAGFRDAGLTPVFGVECDPHPKRHKRSMEIADMYEDNFGDHIIREPAQNINPADLPRVDWFHASLVCKNASEAKRDAKEDNTDMVTAKATVDYFVHHLPKVVTIENVWGYRKFDAFKLIIKALSDNGYGWRMDHINMANYGVPQTRKRLIVTAVHNAPLLPPIPHTHTKNPQGGWFEQLKPWVGWYEAIEDLIPTLPTAYHAKKKRPCEYDPEGRPCRESLYCRGHFADWQLDKLPSEYNARSFVMNAANPNANEKHKYRMAHELSKTVTARGSTSIKAFIVPGGNASSFSVRNENEPARTVGDVDRVGNAPRAFVVNGVPNTNHKSVTVRHG